MGGWGSGNYRRERRSTTEEVRSINVREIEDLALLPDYWASIPYPDTPALRLRRNNDLVTFGISTGSKVIVVARHTLIYSPRNFGGQQAYFQCHCGKRVTNLYMSSHTVACRHCHDLLYESQFASSYEQPAAKAAKLRAKLGGGPALLKPLPDRPKYMHRNTYERITYQILAYEIAAAEQLKRYREQTWVPKLLKMDELVAEL